ncbi:MAG TPA: xanthine dehydrogenase family protein subunit M [Rhodopila sp.]|nr:xanthine dehydrogenase family protein subunit M [Rhodopila sp.]
MRPFSYAAAASPQDAVRAAAQTAAGFLAGGTNLLDLMKIGVMQPAALIDLAPLRAGLDTIRADLDGLHLGAMARMADVADHPDVRRDYPVIAQSLQLAASPQLRNMATLAGNVLQRTRCHYFRDSSWDACNKRRPGSGCAAIGGVNRRLAVLGVSEHCIANYPGDFANALAALGAEVHLLAADGSTRAIPIETLHRLPGDAPHVETNLRAGDLITGFHLPAGAWTRRSCYVKVRDRASWDFALASAAVALDMDGDRVRQARIGLGGGVAKPWRAHEAEAVLNGQRLDEALAEKAAEAAFRGAVTHTETAFKPALGRRTLIRALLEAAALEI